MKPHCKSAVLPETYHQRKVPVYSRASTMKDRGTEPMPIQNLDALHGLPVTQLRIDHAFTVVLVPASGDGADYELRIETEFQFHEGDQALLVDPRETRSMAVALTLFDQTVQRTNLSGDGALEVHFDRARILIPPHATYEAYTLTGPNLHLVCPLSP